MRRRTKYAWVKVGSNAVSHDDGYIIIAEVSTWQQFEDKRRQAELEDSSLFINVNLSAPETPNEKVYLISAKRRGNRENTFVVKAAELHPGSPATIDNLMKFLNPKGISHSTDRANQKTPEQLADEIERHWKYKAHIGTALAGDNIVTFATGIKKGYSEKQQLMIKVTRPGEQPHAKTIDLRVLGFEIATLKMIGDKYSPKELLAIYENADE